MRFKRIAALILALSILIVCLSSCGKSKEELGTGWSPYAESRDITDRDVSYVELSVKGYGRAIILLDATSAPKTVENFLSLVRSGFYDGLTFHRIIKGFMIQGGDPEGNGTGDSGTTIKGEFAENGFENDIKHYPGVISMARGSEADSASCQFFICNSDARSSLDGRYAAFGYVIMGMSVVEKITEEVFPKTALADYYGTFLHSYWEAYGNGAIENDEDKPVIEYIKVLENYVPKFDYSKPDGNNS